MPSTIQEFYRGTYHKDKAYELYLDLKATKPGKYNRQKQEILIELCAPLVYNAVMSIYKYSCEETNNDILSIVICNLWKYLTDGKINSDTSGDFTAHIINYCRSVGRGAIKEVQSVDSQLPDPRDMYKRYELSPQKAYEIKSLFQSLPKMLKKFIDQKDRFRFIDIESQAMAYLMKCIISGEPVARSLLTSWGGVKFENVDFCIEYYTVLCRWALYIIRDRYRDVLVHAQSDYTTYTAEEDVLSDIIGED